MAEKGPNSRSPSTMHSPSEVVDNSALEGTRIDERLDSPTACAPSFRPAGQWLKTADAPDFPRPGERIDDFELLSLLGVGSFGRVFLARQVTLNREVALKVTANRGTEARTLASLEHDHIVHVFSESVEPKRNLRLLCMQLVPGTTLAHIIGKVHAQPRSEWSGRAIVAAIDALTAHPAAFHPAALRDREMLEDADYLQAVCWLISRLAEALDYAHGRDVLHRDIKPANILVNHYGRPLLADFNLAFRALGAEEAREAMFGGTLAYMAPEHLDAFGGVAGAKDAVAHKADIYSLGMVLLEMLAGSQAFSDMPRDEDLNALVKKLAEARREKAPLERVDADIPHYLERVVSRCLTPDPENRYSSARTLARSLDGCRELRRIERELPWAGPATRLALGHPFTTLVTLAILPHVLGSILNISYNALQIVGDLNEAQRHAFFEMVLVYNLIVYPICLYACHRLVTPVWRAWRDRGLGSQLCQEPTWIRRRALSLPMWAVRLACFGWLPGGILFPLAISWRSESVGVDLFCRFLISFTLSGLIALTYSYFGIQFVVLRVLYPYFWPDVRDIQDVIRQEIRPLDARLRLFQFLAGIIPLAGAILLVTVGPDSSGERTFRLLLAGLIIMGMVGFGLALWVNMVMSATLSVLTRRQGRPEEWSRYLGRKK